MNKILLLTLLILFTSCLHNNQGENKDNNKLEATDLKFRKVNDVLYQDNETFIFYYNEYDVCNKKELYQPKEKLKSIKIDSNSYVKDIDLNSFRVTNTFWYDKKYVFFIKDGPTTFEIKTTVIDSSISGIYFKDSKYRIRENKLEYFGQKWLSDEALNCEKNLVDHNLDEFNVLNLKAGENCSLNAYALLKDDFLFHGCQLDLNKISVELKNKLIEAKRTKNFAERIKI